MSDDKNFDRLTLENALAELGSRAFAAGRTVEIVVYGGSALLLTLNRQNSQDALTLVEKFYPQNMLQPKTRLGLEEIFSNLEIDSGNDQMPSSSSEP